MYQYYLFLQLSNLSIPKNNTLYTSLIGQQFSNFYFHIKYKINWFNIITHFSLSWSRPFIQISLSLIQKEQFFYFVVALNFVFEYHVTINGIVAPKVCSMKSLSCSSSGPKWARSTPQSSEMKFPKIMKLLLQVHWRILDPWAKNIIT